MLVHQLQPCSARELWDSPLGALHAVVGLPALCGCGLSMDL